MSISISRNQWAVYLIIMGVGLGLSVVSTDALASPGPAKYDKGDLGQYVRDGARLLRIKTTAKTASSAVTSSGHRAIPAGPRSLEGRVVYDKGDLGKYFRNGSRVLRVASGVKHRPCTMDHSDKVRVVNHIKHKHRFPK